MLWTYPPPIGASGRMMTTYADATAFTGRATQSTQSEIQERAEDAEMPQLPSNIEHKIPQISWNVAIVPAIISPISWGIGEMLRSPGSPDI